VRPGIKWLLARSLDAPCGDQNVSRPLGRESARPRSAGSDQEISGPVDIGRIAGCRRDYELERNPTKPAFHELE
jgi:hypothetical protein